MDIQSYIESGVLEMYALDQLDLNEREEVERMASVFPEIKAELESIQRGLEMYAASQGIRPNPNVREKIKNTIEELEKEKELDLQDPPLISPFSDHTLWLAAVNNLLPSEIPAGEPFMKILNQTKGFQALIVSATDIGDEVHKDVHESFLILKGRCKCTVGADERFMGPGDFMSIPLYEHHDVEILSDNVVAILQRVPVLA